MVLIEVTAPGKVILHGEHAVVYGKHAIAISISMRTCVKLTSRSDDKVELHMTKLEQNMKWDLEFLQSLSSHKDDAIDKLSPMIVNDIQNSTILDSVQGDIARTSALMFLFLYSGILSKYYDGPLPALTIDVDTELCVGANLGSSASYGVCLSTVFLLLCGKINKDLSNLDRELISSWAFQAEKIPHFSPSGIDNTVCTYGGAILYKGKDMVKRLSSVPKLKAIIVNTSEPKNTKEMVCAVKQKFLEFPAVFNSILGAIDNVTLQAWEIIEILHTPAFGTVLAENLMHLVQMNHYLLNALGVGHCKIDEIVNLSKEHRCGAKITGAGGGGCALIVQPPATGCGQEMSELCKSNITHLKEQLAANGFEFWDSDMGSTGVEVKRFHLQECNDIHFTDASIAL